MFDRYDEPARRTLFLARYEATKLRSRSIGGEHLLLGLIREHHGNAARLLGALHLSDLRKELESGLDAGPEVPVSVEIPFSSETKQMLAFAAEEADSLAHRVIGTEHLLLGVLRAEGATAAAALGRYGMRLDAVREQVRELANVPPSADASTPEAGALIRTLIQQMSASASQIRSMLSSEEASMRVELLLMDLKALQSLLDGRS
jgi:ATP-dependent Clp protease ATP-binding subunit ClpC